MFLGSAEISWLRLPSPGANVRPLHSPETQSNSTCSFVRIGFSSAPKNLGGFCFALLNHVFFFFRIQKVFFSPKVLFRMGNMQRLVNFLFRRVPFSCFLFSRVPQDFHSLNRGFLQSGFPCVLLHSTPLARGFFFPPTARFHCRLFRIVDSPICRFLDYSFPAFPFFRFLGSSFFRFPVFSNLLCSRLL